jgi:hypothetical protein
MSSTNAGKPPIAMKVRKAATNISMAPRAYRRHTQFRCKSSCQGIASIMSKCILESMGGSPGWQWIRCRLCSI